MRDIIEAIKDSWRAGWLAKDLISLAVVGGFLVVLCAFLAEIGV